MKKILFICTGNSCRSQIAEGLAKSLGWEAYSAGTHPIGVNPDAVAVLEEAGINISDQTSDHIDKYIADDFDFVVTLCDNAREICPVFPNHQGIKFHHGFTDPYYAIGNREEILDAYRKTRDDIKKWLQELNSK